jgi:hypothetical protein
MRKLILAALLTAAPLLAVTSTPVAACDDWFGYNASYAPRYSYAPRAYGYYGSRGYYGRTYGYYGYGARVVARGVVRRAAWRRWR